MKYVKPMAEDVKLLLSNVILASVAQEPDDDNDDGSGDLPPIGDGDVNVN